MKRPKSKNPPQNILRSASDKQSHIFSIVALLILTTVSAYWQVGQCGFVNLDDDAYVESQPMVNQGFRSAGIVWAFTGIHSSNWHPLTSLSHMLDCQLFGIRPGPMHWENLLWHVFNTLLVFFLWRKMSGALWRSAMVAGLFALHPLHVESVAWISERKDVLSTFFGFISVWFYVRYAQSRVSSLKFEVSGLRAGTTSNFKPQTLNYSFALIFFALSLMSKPMLVTLPFLLLLLDYWPLRRVTSDEWRVKGSKMHHVSRFTFHIPRLVLEKIPFVILSVIHSVITFFVQQASGAANYGERFSLIDRVNNAFVSYFRYLGKTFWPEPLSPLYFHSGHWPASIVLSSVMLFAGISLLVWWQRRNRPWLAFGWLWFVGTLVPVIGLVQVGAQSIADRYTYVPLLGVFTILAWQGAALANIRPRVRPILVFVTLVALAFCFFLTRQQVRSWKNSIVLYEHSIAHGEDNAAIRYLLAAAMQKAQQPEAAVVAQYRRSLEYDPSYINALTQLAALELQNQRPDEARKLIEETVRLEPKNPTVHKTLGALCVRIGKTNEAMIHFTDALQLDPDYADARREVGWILMKENRLQEACIQFEAIVRSNPWDAEALFELGIQLGNLGRLEEARGHLRRALWIRPDFSVARQNLEKIEQHLGR